jgi:hypothetical protein
MSPKEPAKSNTSQPHGLRSAPKNLPNLDQVDLVNPTIQRAYHIPHTLTPRDIHHLQRTLGNRAVNRLITKTVPPTPSIQRVIPHNLNWGDEEEMYQERKRNNDFAPGRNKGWIKILIPPAEVPITVFAQSQFGEQHTEEKLIDLAVNTHHANLATAPDAHPQAGPRIISLYTERAPCTPGNADPARQQRNQGNCQAYLQQALHPGVKVGYSVANSNADHATLLGRQSLRKTVEEEIDFLHRYARSTYNNEHKKRFGYLPSQQSYEGCWQDSLHKTLQAARQILWSNVTAEAVINGYNDAKKMIENETVQAQLEIDETINTYVYQTILVPETPPNSPLIHNY